MRRLFGRRGADAPGAPPQRPAELSGWRKGLNRTSAAFSRLWQLAVAGGVEVGEQFYHELADTLVLADVGAELAASIVNHLRKDAADRGLVRVQDVRTLLEGQLVQMLAVAPAAPLVEEGRLNVLLFAGVNGTGKTTMLAKVGRMLLDGGLNIVAAAADTFRAAAVEQLNIWGKRVGFPVITGTPGADPASVVYNAVEHALAQHKDAVLIDTAGRMQTRQALLDELGKIGRAARKVAQKRGVDAASALHEVNLLVLDATTGQNAIAQAKLFSGAIPLHGLILTKLDGTAKGGVILAVVRAVDVPVVLLGVGEQAGDLLEFDPHSFARALLGEAG